MKSMATPSIPTYHHSKRKNTLDQWLHPVCQPTIIPRERIHRLSRYTQYANLPSCQEKQYIGSMATPSMPTYHHSKRKNTLDQWLHPVCQPTIIPRERIHEINGYTQYPNLPSFQEKEYIGSMATPSMPTYHHSKRKNT